MLKSYRFWLWTAVVLLAITCLIHGITLFIQPAAQNETERQLRELMTTYKMDFGAGFKRSTQELVTALSSCFSLICLLGALTLGYLNRREAELQILRGVVGVHLLVFCLTLGVMIVFTFLPPIILTGLIVLSLLLSWILLGKAERSQMV